MFGIFKDTATAALNVTGDTLETLVGGDGPSKEDLATLIDAGLTVAAISEGLGISQEVLEKILAD